MKYIIILLPLIFAFSLNGQVNTGQNGTQYFAQFTYQETLSEQEVAEFDDNLQQNPNIKLVRVDVITKGVLIVTHNLNEFNENTVVSWISTNFPVIDCYREGLFRVDDIIPFNDNFCSTTE
jgi:hypothetical protein